MDQESLKTLLEEGDRRSNRPAKEAIPILLDNPHLAPMFLEWAQSPQPVLAMRAADVLESASRVDPRLIQNLHKDLLRFLPKTHQQEVQWHLAIMLRRLNLSPAERKKASEVLESWFFDSKSRILQVEAMHTLYLFAHKDPPLQNTMDTIRAWVMMEGAPSHRARLRLLEKGKFSPVGERF